jgi:hypothetical protein
MDSSDYSRFVAHMQPADNDCVNWTGAFKEGRPVFYPREKGQHGSRSARLLWFQELHGVRPEAVKLTCGNELCLAHLAPRNVQPPELKAASRRSYLLRARGANAHRDPAVAEAHIRELHEGGMSYRRMSQLCRLSAASLADLGRGSWVRIRPVDERLVLGIVPDAVVDGRGSSLTGLASRRRLQAMCHDGFGPASMAMLSGMGGSTLHRQMNGSFDSSPDRLPAVTIARILELYLKLDGVWPGDLGVTSFQIKRAKNTALKNNYAPRHCWDDDTIDDPDAFPEWTGECGTEGGYKIHQREGHEFHVRGRIYVGCAECRKAMALIRQGEWARRRDRNQARAAEGAQ